MLPRLFALVVVVVVASCATAAPVATALDPALANTPEKQKAVAVLNAFETGETAAFDAFDAEHYIQHNPAAADGAAGLKQLTDILKVIPGPLIKMRALRVFQDGDMVFTHSHADLFGKKAVFDVMRFSDGKIVEHWDNFQDAGGENAAGHSMIDGPIIAADLDKTVINKALVIRYVDDVFLKGKVDKISDYLDGQNHIEHRAGGDDGAAALIAWLPSRPSYQWVHHVLGEGSFVLVMGEGRESEVPVAIYDLFRVEGGKIAEHWSVVEAIPPKSSWKNTNGKF
ncbi:MAG: nuclear transport factor 2 family protein [Deltaproteobacteria bacterium]|nr:nuclear transport factor 2 family protein [Deltaproteobacteria bacterium]